MEWWPILIVWVLSSLNLRKYHWTVLPPWEGLKQKLSEIVLHSGLCLGVSAQLNKSTLASELEHERRLEGQRVLGVWGISMSAIDGISEITVVWIREITPDIVLDNIRSLCWNWLVARNEEWASWCL